VLHLYSFDKPVCLHHLDLVGAASDPANPVFYDDGGYKKGQPWLYYLDSEGSATPGSEVIRQSGRVKFRTSFSYENRDVGIVRKL
jgi:hypothetical protein